MIITTTPYIDGRGVQAYKGAVFGEVVIYRGIPKEQDLISARQQALAKMEQNAADLGANAVIGMKVEYAGAGYMTQYLLVTASGTAVVVH